MYVSPCRLILSRLTCLAWAAAILLGSRHGIASEDFQVLDLRCEWQVNPMGIDASQPRLSWRVESPHRGTRQAAYRILVASSAENLESGQYDCWDSGRVESAHTLNIVYQGQPLASRATCFWKVQVWGRGEQEWEVVSPTAFWSMGLLEQTDWQAEYISYRDDTPIFDNTQELFLPPARQYRREFQVEGNPIRRAVVYATALGIYELYLNGRRVGDEWFAPGWTDYRQRAYYRAYDVTDMVEPGDNAIGASVADGWYAGYVGFGLLTGMGTERIGRYTYGKTPSVMAQLEIEYADGTRCVIGTDKTWKVTDSGPIREADMLMGEAYDARRELTGWTETDYDDSAWEQAILASENGNPTATFYEARDPVAPDTRVEIKGQPIELGFQRPRLEAFPGVPVRVTERLPAASVEEKAPGKYLYNLGQNMAGTIELRIQGPAGTEVTLRYGEMLYPDGRLMTENLRKARAIDRYILKGDPRGETYIPRFTFHGFQYVEATVEPSGALTAPPQVTGLVLHSDTPLTSTFECSDPMVNRLFQNVVWTQRANFIDLPTDCPQRDERMGWTGDAQAYVGTAAYNADVAAFFTKWLRELMESQRPSGAFPGFAPFPFQHGWSFGTAWADAGIICPWTIWQAYGDTRIIEQCWEPMTRFMQWRLQTSRDYLGVDHGNDWGDWLAQGAPTPLEYIDTVYFAISSRMMAQMAEAIDREEEARLYHDQFQKIFEAFNKEYVNDDGTLTVNTQTAYALALFAELIPRDQRRATGAKLAEMIRENGTRMSTGFLGTRPLLPVLTSVGQHDLAVFLFQSRAFPSWGYEVEQGATTIWERWDSYTKEDGFGRHNAAMNSFSHYAFGAVCEWMFNTLAGIRSQGPGYERIVIRPRPAAPGSNAEREVIQWVKASYQCVRGRIVSNWRIDGDRFELEVEIPANTTARVVLPAVDLAHVTESGVALDEAPGVLEASMRRNQAIVSIGSGHYQFSSAGAIKPATESFQTSLPPDRSANPEGVDLTDAKILARWDFASANDVAKWPQRNNLQVEQRGESTLLVGNGADPQIETRLATPATGKLVIALEARPAKEVDVEFFWATPGGGYDAAGSNKRQLNAADQVQQYLFRIGSGEPVQQLRFDPLSDAGELQIGTITLYQLPE